MNANSGSHFYHSVTVKDNGFVCFFIFPTIFRQAFAKKRSAKNGYLLFKKSERFHLSS